MKKFTLVFCEEGIQSSVELANSHAGGRIEIHEHDKEYHIEEIRLLLPRPIFQALRDRLDGMEFLLPPQSNSLPETTK